MFEPNMRNGQPDCRMYLGLYAGPAAVTLAAITPGTVFDRRALFEGVEERFIEEPDGSILPAYLLTRRLITFADTTRLERYLEAANTLLSHPAGGPDPAPNTVVAVLAYPNAKRTRIIHAVEVGTLLRLVLGVFDWPTVEIPLATVNLCAGHVPGCPGEGGHTGTRALRLARTVYAMYNLPEDPVKRAALLAVRRQYTAL